MLRFPHPRRSASSGHRQIRRRFLSDPNAPLAGKAIAALVSLVSPIDAVPDLIPLVGLTDAVGVPTLAFAKLATDLKQYLSS